MHANAAALELSLLHAFRWRDRPSVVAEVVLDLPVVSWAGMASRSLPLELT
jgi:hypothetical protein